MYTVEILKDADVYYLDMEVIFTFTNTDRPRAVENAKTFCVEAGWTEEPNRDGEVWTDHQNRYLFRGYSHG